MHGKFAFFAILKNFKGGTLGKKKFSKFSQSFYFLLGEHMSLLEWNRRISECIKTKDSLNVTLSWWCNSKSPKNSCCLGLPTPFVKEEFQLDLDILSCVDGFILVLGRNLDIIYVSENVTHYIGLTQVFQQ